MILKQSRASLSSNWKKADKDQQKEFVELFSSLLFDTYVKRIKENVGNADVEVTGLSRNKKGNKAILKTKVDTGKESASIFYRMKAEKNTWQVYDVVIENVGLVSNYRNEFSGIIRKRKIEGLLQNLRDKIKES